jgi:Ca2+-binding EF-hand superfamily protein
LPQHFDTDNSGYIEKEELKAFMKRFIYQGLDLSDEELNGAVDIVDSNHVGSMLFGLTFEGWSHFPGRVYYLHGRAYQVHEA